MITQKQQQDVLQLYTNQHQMLADTVTPVSIYLNLRDLFPGSVLLESSDYSSRENSLSFLAFDSIAEIKFQNGKLHTSRNGVLREEKAHHSSVSEIITAFTRSFSSGTDQLLYEPISFYGYNTFESVVHFEDIDLKTDSDIPEIHYKLFRYQLIIDHYKNTLTILETLSEEEPSQMDKIVRLICRATSPMYKFRIHGTETSNLTDQDYLEMVKKGIRHCQLGDVFQVVLSRKFEQNFTGDEFNVYRTLRSINPSPYLFFFDFENFKLFGSSPEAQLKVKNGKAEIHPIAGTYRRTGDFEKDQALAQTLLSDPKENAEHTMLVDLARNDLSKSAKNVCVTSFRAIQYFSHVIHMVSTVTGDVPDNAYQTFADTFPAGTLSGAPKYKAMQLINLYEPSPRGFYGGSVGIITNKGMINKAILIRSFRSKNNTLTYQAGAGIVAKSDPESEIREVNNKVGALRMAIERASQL